MSMELYLMEGPMEPLIEPLMEGPMDDFLAKSRCVRYYQGFYEFFEGDFLS